jgi:uncharacterized protein with HEPN domain
MSEHDDLLYVSHIIEACERAERFVASVLWQEFEHHEEKQSAVIRQLEIIAEARRRTIAARLVCACPGGRL